MKKPLIGIVLDSEEKGDFSEYPYYVLRKHYFDAVAKVGGIAIGIDHTKENIAEYINLLDGLLMPGGDYDIPPSFYGETIVHSSIVTKIERLDFDRQIVQKFLDADKPILGICAGEQLLAAMHGGTLIQDIESEVKDFLNHYNADREVISHEVTIAEKTLLHKIIGKKTIGVNSHHHQSVKTVGAHCIVSAYSSDGVIEAIEIIDKRFCLGVQWHPEFENNPSDVKIFEAFIEACKIGYKN